MATAIRQLVAEYIQAVGEDRFDRVEELPHPDVVFSGTAPELRGPQAYVGALAGSHRSWSATRSSRSSLRTTRPL